MTAFAQNNVATFPPPSHVFYHSPRGDSLHSISPETISQNKKKIVCILMPIHANFKICYFLSTTRITMQKEIIAWKAKKWNAKSNRLLRVISRPSLVRNSMPVCSFNKKSFFDRTLWLLRSCPIQYLVNSKSSLKLVYKVGRQREKKRSEM